MNWMDRYILKRMWEVKGMKKARLLSLDYGWMVGPDSEVPSMGEVGWDGEGLCAVLDRTC